MVKFRFHVLFLSLLCVLSLAGCSSSNPVQITLSPTTPPVINAGQSQAVTATVANDVNHQGVTWSISGAGNLTGQTSTSVTFVAPVDISIQTTTTVTATSVANTTVTATLNISVNPVLGISTGSLPVGTVGVAYVGVIGAVGATGTFTWTLTKGNLPPGLSLSSSTNSSVTIVGTPQAVGTSSFTVQVADSSGSSVSRTFSITVNPPPPLSVATHSLPQGTVGVAYGGASGVPLNAASGTMPYSWMLINNTVLPQGLSLSTAGVISGTPTTAGQSMFSVQVTDSSNPPQQASATLTITINPSSAGDSQLSGNYAFLVNGFSGSAQFATAGRFFADGNGNITNGLLDSNTQGTLPLNQTFTGSYAIAPNGLGTMTLNATGGSYSFAVAIAPSGAVQVLEVGSATGSGVLLKQAAGPFSNSTILNGYALGFLGADAQGKRYGLAGECTADGSGHFNSGMLDSNDAGTVPPGPQAFVGSYSVPSGSTSGRGTATITIGSQPPTNYAFYLVSSTQVLVVETDFISGQGSPLVSGSMLQQSLTFSGGVFETTDANSSNQVGLLTASSGTTSLDAEQNVGGTVMHKTSSGSYQTSSFGRVVLTGSGIASPDPVLYLASTTENGAVAFVLGTDAAVTFGFMESQPNPGSFSTSSLSGTYAGGLIPPVQSGATEQVDIASADGAGNTSFATDLTSNGGLLQNQSSAATYTLSSIGAGVLTYLPPSSAVGYFYMVSPTEFYELYAGAEAAVEHFQP